MSTFARGTQDETRRFLSSICAGEADAVSEWYRGEHPEVYRLAVGFLSDPVEAEDLAQDAMLHLLDKMPTFNGENYRAWRNAVVLNLSRDRSRRLATRRRHEARRSGSGRASASAPCGGPPSTQWSQKLIGYTEFAGFPQKAITPEPIQGRSNGWRRTACARRVIHNRGERPRTGQLARTGPRRTGPTRVGAVFARGSDTRGAGQQRERRNTGSPEGVDLGPRKPGRGGSGRTPRPPACCKSTPRSSGLPEPGDPLLLAVESDSACLPGPAVFGFELQLE